MAPADPRGPDLPAPRRHRGRPRQGRDRVVLASGRPLEGMTAALTELGLTGQDDYVICYSSPWCSRCPSNASSAASC